MELAALGGRCLEGVGYHLHGNLASGHLVFQLADALAGLLRNHSQRVEAGVNHLQQVLTHQLASAAHLSKGKRQRVELLRITHRDVTYLAQYGHHLLGLDVETKQSLSSFRQVLHHHRGVHRKTPDVAKQLATLARAGKGLKRDLQGFNLTANVHNLMHEVRHLTHGKHTANRITETVQGLFKTCCLTLSLHQAFLQVALHQKLYRYRFHDVSFCYSCKLLWKKPSTSSPPPSPSLAFLFLT